MGLPQLNTTFKHEMTLPVSKQKVTFRPYLVQEEKILLAAAESRDTGEVLKSISTILENCIEDVNPSKLSIPDVEYAFVNIRAKAAGEMTTIGLDCVTCSATNDVSVNLEDVVVNIEEAEKLRMITIEDGITLEMRYPTLADAINNPNLIEVTSQVEAMFDMLDLCIDTVYTDEEAFKFKEQDKGQRESFINSMSHKQFMKMQEFLAAIPSAELSLSFLCDKCGASNDRELRGIQHFFG